MGLQLLLSIPRENRFFKRQFCQLVLSSHILSLSPSSVHSVKTSGLPGSCPGLTGAPPPSSAPCKPSLQTRARSSYQTPFEAHRGFPRAPRTRSGCHGPLVTLASPNGFSVWATPLATPAPLSLSEHTPTAALCKGCSRHLEHFSLFSLAPEPRVGTQELTVCARECVRVCVCVHVRASPSLLPLPSCIGRVVFPVHCPPLLEQKLLPHGVGLATVCP